ncbi:O-acetyltransferase A [Gordonia phage LonelyBoi]|nr:O-acetyltransferase A [Gordonia phage LonelyBoi]
MRLDIQGLRAVAVILVILDHLFEWPKAGFIGVDVFFVISGFVITAGLQRGYGRTGTISFGDFYRKRARRIIPASTLVLVATCAAAAYAFYSSRFHETLIDAVWAFFFASNWRFAFQGTNYLTAEGPVSPLQHYWSLGIEEQFYVVWPLLMLGVFTLAASRGLHAHSERIAAAAIGLVIAVSFSWAMIQTATHAEFAYFSTFTRVWELGIGAMLALLAVEWKKIPDAARPFLAWVGLLGILVSAFIVSSESGFPAPWAALPVLATALVIAAGTGGERKHLYPLTNPVASYIGDISYSLYLWHFPVIVILAAMMPSGWRYHFLCLALMSILSVLSYHILEDPVRKSTWLEPKAVREDRRRLRRGASTTTLADSVGSAKWKIISLTAVLLVALAVVADGRGSDMSSVPDFTAAGQVSDNGAPTSPLQAGLVEGVEATKWPANLSPSLEELGDISFPTADANGCAPATPRGRDCTIAGVDPSRLAVVVGDSISVAWLPAIRAALEPKGWTVAALPYIGCPFVDGATENADATVVRTCPAHKQEVVDIINRAKPALVIGSSTNNIRSARGESPENGARALSDQVAKIDAAAGRYVQLSPPPSGDNPQECATRFSSPRECLGGLPSNYTASVEAQKAVMAGPGRQFVDTSDWFCTPEGDCPILNGSTLIRRDTSHITPQYAKVIAPQLASALLTTG